MRKDERNPSRDGTSSRGRREEKFARCGRISRRLEIKKVTGGAYVMKDSMRERVVVESDEVRIGNGGPVGLGRTDCRGGGKLWGN